MKAEAEKAAPTRFKAELWTTSSGREVWATVMLDGPDEGWPCAFGPKEIMKQYAEQLNKSEGIIR